MSSTQELKALLGCKKSWPMMQIAIFSRHPGNRIVSLIHQAHNTDGTPCPPEARHWTKSSFAHCAMHQSLFRAGYVRSFVKAHHFGVSNLESRPYDLKKSTAEKRLIVLNSETWKTGQSRVMGDSEHILSMVFQSLLMLCLWPFQNDYSRVAQIS